MTTYEGACHCGAIGVEFQTERAPSELPVRQCQCSFCRKHGGRTTTDAAGSLRFIGREPAALERYRFGKRITDFLVCKRCGIYVGAVMAVDEGVVGTLNINVLANNLFGERVGDHADYDGETADGAALRRAKMWTPARVVPEG
jgi:hypothetical protein